MVRYMLCHFCPNFRLYPNSSVTHTAILSGKSNSQQSNGSLHMLACFNTRERTDSHFYSRRHLVSSPDKTRRHLVSKDPTFTATNTIVYNCVGGRGEGGGEGRREGSAYGWCTIHTCQRRGLGPFQGPPSQCTFVTAKVKCLRE